MVVALIDGDILLYRIGHTTLDVNEAIAKARMDDLVDSILVETDATEFEVWLSDKTENGFRYAIYPQYKANRVLPRPLHYELLKEHLVREWGARIALEMEADDALGINQGWGDSVICSIDKDLLQIPGEHYNFVKKEWQTVTPWTGLKWFYKQILIGDNVDNIRGCRGIGPVKASKALDSIPQEAGEEALFEKVVKLYEKQEKQASQQEILDHILLVGRLLKIKQTEDEELWHFPKSYPMVDNKLSSTVQVLAPENIQFTEPTTQGTGTGFQSHGTDKATLEQEKLLPST